MHVRFHGFCLTPGGVLLKDFAQHLGTQSASEFPFLGSSRLLYSSLVGDEFVGLLLTARDQKKFCELNSGESFKIKVRQLRGSNRLVDFNFFVMSLATGKGIYQVYRGSCGLPTFGKLMKHCYREL